MNALRSLSLSIILWSICLFAMPMHALVLWHDKNGASGNSPISSDVIDEDIDIKGTNELQGPIHVSALSADITITVTNNSSTLTSYSASTEDTANLGRLYLYADTGRLISFELDQDLTFRGTSYETEEIDLLISVSGAGTVQFVIDSDHSVTFTSLTDSGGALLYLGMASTGPTLQFHRSADQTNDVEIKIGPKSGISYISENEIAANGGATDEATIEFDPAATSSSRMILRLDNDARFIIFGHFISDLTTNFVLEDIQLTKPAGKTAAVVITNSDSSTSTAGLMVINTNQTLTPLVIDPWDDGAFLTTGTQIGFILGANGSLTVEDMAYLDYVSASTNQCPDPTISEDVLSDDEEVTSIVKFRNPSAFWVDGNSDEDAVAAAIALEGASAIYFRSGCDKDGVVDESAGSSGFVIDFINKTSGQGNIVFSIEGPLDVTGTGTNKLEILSLDVHPTGGSILVGSGETLFPLRSFSKDSGDEYLRYNSGSFLINNRLNLDNVVLFHSDLNHNVYNKNYLPSEPTYVGGETFKLRELHDCAGERPKIVFKNASFELHADVALTGVDLFVPNVGAGNASHFTFFFNGRAIDAGSGRQLILGTSVGALACDGTLIDQDTHLDIFQESPQDEATHTLTLLVAPNDDTITEDITGSIAGQNAIHTIYLSNSSNISIGTEGTTGMTQTCTDTFTLTTSPTLWIAGDFFSFETQGGLKGYPESCATEGEGAMFVDRNGTVAIQQYRRANVSMMIVTSANGTVSLPKSQVFFDTRIGIAHWKVDLANEGARVLIDENQDLSDFTFDWLDTTKSYTGDTPFVPYELAEVPAPCASPAVTDANLRALPEVRGVVDQFQVKRSRLGDQVHLKVNGGRIKELVFLSGYDSAEAPVGFLVLENFGRVGVGTAHRNTDSLDASVKLGINGLTVAANGDGIIELNENVLVDNVCHILTGTSFGVDEEQTLLIRSTLPHEFRIKTGGVLDLTAFADANQVIEFGGAVALVFEPGARIILGGGVLKFTDQATIAFERIVDENELVGVDVSTNDEARVRMSGSGTVIMADDATMFVPRGANFGIEAYDTCTEATNIRWILNDQAKIQIGNESSAGGVFQIGNTTDIDDSTVTFTLILDGIGAELQIDHQGMLGLGVGIVDKSSNIPNEWIVGSLFNGGSINIDVQEGIITHNQIVSGNSNRASLLAIGGTGTFNFSFDSVNSVIRAGGNLVRVGADETDLVPLVDTVSGQIGSADASAGIMASKDLLLEPANGTLSANATPTQFFTYLSTIPYQSQFGKLANIAQDELGQQIVGYVRTVAGTNIINRLEVFRIEGGSFAQPVDPSPSVERGAVAINIQDSTGNINSIAQLVG